MAVALQKSPFPGIESRELAQQLTGKKKAAEKLPSWHTTEGVYYPPSRSLEQSSSEKTARYKAGLLSGETLLDLTAGLGVDSYFLSKKFRKVNACEKDGDLAEITAHNMQVLGAGNVVVYHRDGVELLKETGSEYSWIYIDPSRRDAEKNRVFRLEESSPDITSILSLLMEHTHRVLVKTAPFLDIAAGLEALQHVAEIHVVAVENDVKELLWIVQKGVDQEPLVTTINLGKTGRQVFTFRRSEEAVAALQTGFYPPFLYVPNAAILKSGAFKLVGERYGVAKLHQHSHLYTSEKQIDFPGKTYKIVNSTVFSTSVLKKSGITRANIATRNFPLSVSEIRKKFKIAEGGDRYLFLTKGPDGAGLVLDCVRA